jgi:hypothetical protein
MIGAGPVAPLGVWPIDLSLPRAHFRLVELRPQAAPPSVGNLRSPSLPTVCMGYNVCRPPATNVDVGFGSTALGTVPLKV